MPSPDDFSHDNIVISGTWFQKFKPTWERIKNSNNSFEREWKRERERERKKINIRNRLGDVRKKEDSDGQILSNSNGYHVARVNSNIHKHK